MTNNDNHPEPDEWGWHNVKEPESYMDGEEECKFCGSEIRRQGDKYGGIIRCKESGVALADW